ncbi:envelope-like protein, partial [Trifolium medium]|nr:envelope-like protein [Trifolium medium]
MNQRRVALERNLSDDLLQCQERVELIEAVGLMQTVKGLGKYYDKLLREFIVSIGEDCDDSMSTEFMK